MKTPEQASREAYASVDHATAKARVLEYLTMCGSEGATDDEIEVALSMIHQTASSTRRGLVKDGEVVNAGRRRVTRTGRGATVWIVRHANRTPTPHRPPKTPERQPTMWPVGKGWQYTRKALEDLTGERHRLVWRVDLLEDVGTPDMADDPNGYADGRWTGLLDRMWQHLRDCHPLPHGEPDGGDNPERLALLVRCCWEGEWQWCRVSVDTRHVVDVARLADARPPVGRWCIVSEKRLAAMGTALPVGWFRDGIPF